MSSRKRGLGLMALAFIFSGCQVIDDAFVLNNEEPPPIDPIDPGPQCFNERFNQASEVVSRKIDILFVTDSSFTLQEERESIAMNLDAFLSAFPPEVDYRVAVMMGHGPNSPWHGALYQESSEPLVLASHNDDGTPAMSGQDIRDDLRQKMTNVIYEAETDGGEMLMASANAALDNANQAAIRSEGFLRNDAALAVLFVSDENDICAEYPEGVEPVEDISGREEQAKMDWCSRMNPDTNEMEDITAQLIVDKYTALKAPSQRFVLGALVYNQLATVPEGGENEYGYGFMDMVALADGISVDLADESYAEGLESIGQLASVSWTPILTFTPATPDFNESSLQVLIDGIPSTNFSYDPVLNQITFGDLGLPGSTFDIIYCVDDPDDPGGGNGGIGV